MGQSQSMRQRSQHMESSVNDCYKHLKYVRDWGRQACMKEYETRSTTAIKSYSLNVTKFQSQSAAIYSKTYTHQSSCSN